jgi:hypothetical protein
MRTVIILSLCLILVGCETETVDTSVPLDLDVAVVLFCKEANKKLPRGSHVIVRKKDIESVNNASGEYIHWKIMLNFTGRKGINAYDNDNVATTDIKGEGDVFTVGVRLEKWEGVPFYRGFFSMDKNGVKAANTSVLRKDYAITTEGILSELLRQQATTRAAGSSSAANATVDETGSGFLKIVNASEEDKITGLRVYKGKSLVMDKSVSIRHSGGSETYELPSGTYQLHIKDDFNSGFCSTGAVKITNAASTTKTYKGCNK